MICRSANMAEEIERFVGALKADAIPRAPTVQTDHKALNPAHELHWLSASRRSA